MSVRLLKTSLLALGAMSLSACVSLGGNYPSNGGGYGQNYPGQGYPDNRYPDNGYPTNAPLQTENGTVESNDPNNGRFRLRTTRGAYLELVYDRYSRLIYQGQQADPSGLERGDGIRVQFRAIGDGRYYAQDIEVLRNVRGDTGSSQPGTYNGARSPTMANGITGAVARNNVQAKVLEYTRGGYTGTREYVRYDPYTIVEYQGSRVAPSGQRYTADQLEAGDMIRIDGRPMGNEVLAERIIVTQSAQARR